MRTPGRRKDGMLERLLALCGRAPAWLVSVACLLAFYATDTHYAPGDRNVVVTLAAALSLVIAPLMVATATGQPRDQRPALAAFWCLFGLTFSLLPPTRAGEHYRRYRSVRPGMTVAQVRDRLATPGLLRALPDEFGGVVSVLDGDRLDATAQRFLIVFDGGRVVDRRFGAAEDWLYRYRAVHYGMREPQVRALLQDEVAALDAPTVQTEATGNAAAAWTSPGWKWYSRSGVGPGGVHVQYDTSGVVHKEYLRAR